MGQTLHINLESLFCLHPIKKKLKEGISGSTSCPWCEEVEQEALPSIFSALARVWRAREMKEDMSSV